MLFHHNTSGILQAVLKCWHVGDIIWLCFTAVIKYKLMVECIFNSIGILGSEKLSLELVIAIKQYLRLIREFSSICKNLQFGKHKLWSFNYRNIWLSKIVTIAKIRYKILYCKFIPNNAMLLMQDIDFFRWYYILFFFLFLFTVYVFH